VLEDSVPLTVAWKTFPITMVIPIRVVRLIFRLTSIIVVPAVKVAIFPMQIQFAL